MFEQGQLLVGKNYKTDQLGLRVTKFPVVSTTHRWPIRRDIVTHTL